MGIKINYFGKLNEPGLAGKIIRELEDISNEMDWEYTVINEEPNIIGGIVITPHPKSEPFSFIFDLNGFTLSIMDISPGETEVNTEQINYVSVKTQYTPVEIHIAMIKLLKYLKKKYINDLEVMDEGCYWETGDKELLINKISFLNEMMDKIADVLDNIKVDKNEPKESIIEKIENVLKERFGNN